MKVLVTGAAGFVGSHVTDFLLSQDCEVLGIDNFSTGQSEFVEGALKNPKFRLEKLDLLECDKVSRVTANFKPQWVFHFAANADVRFGLQHPRKDLEQNTIATFNILEASRLAGAEKFAFTSTGSVYGEPDVFPTPENCPFPVQTSLYAASKLAGEGLVQAYAEGYGIKGYIFRFVSILGPRYTHGHILDFAISLLKNPRELRILGNGQQRKAYLHIEDCVSAVWAVMKERHEKWNIYNLGPDEYVTVNESVDVICKVMGVNPARQYAGGERGWIGDSPFIFLDCKKLKATGWKPRYTIRESVEKTLQYLLANQWLFERRPNP